VPRRRRAAHKKKEKKRPRKTEHGNEKKQYRQAGGGSSSGSRRPQKNGCNGKTCEITQGGNGKINSFVAGDAIGKEKGHKTKGQKRRNGERPPQRQHFILTRERDKPKQAKGDTR